jgi:signal transduction histidine kinase/CheY-like chemotaxis protein
VPYALFALVCALTLAVTCYVSFTTQARITAAHLAAQARFLTEADKTRQQIQVRLDTNVEIIRAGAALLAASNEISHVEFRAFVAGLQLRERYPAMDGIGFAPRVGRQRLQAFRRAVDLDGIRALRTWQPSVQREYHPVLLLEPRNGSTRMVRTHDISTDPIIRQAMESARDTAQPAASGKLGSNSPFNREGKGMFVVLVPVYRVGLPKQSVDARRQSIFGFIFSPLSAADLFQGIASTTSTRVEFAVHDGTTANSDTLLTAPARTTNRVTYQSAQVVTVAGRNWLVDVSSTDPVVGDTSQVAAGTLAGGLLLALLLLLTMQAQVRAWETSVRHELQLLGSQDAMRESEARAQAADRAKDEFLATLSHELRTPLNTILGWVTMLRSGSVRIERQAHALAVIERNALLQSELIEDLLDISRIVTGKVRLQFGAITVTPIVATAVESLRPSAEAKGITLQAPSATATLIARADTQRLQQIVCNLVSNAIKFTPTNGRVDVELSNDDRYIHLSVRDTGIGIASEFLPQVFERFRQADSSTTRPHSGLGLGLAIVRQLVELHGGSVEAFSGGRDCGAQFLVHLPLAASRTADSPEALIPGDVLPSRVLQGIRLLVVDDDPNTREVLTEALSVAGATVLSAESAADALQVLKVDGGADVLISDIAMPGEDGLSLIRRVRAQTGKIAHIPAIALTAFARAEDRARAIEAGYQMYLVKPVALIELQAGVAQIARIRLDASNA